MPKETDTTEAAEAPTSSAHKSVTGMFTIHFEVTHEVHELLAHLGAHKHQTEHEVAKEVLFAWIRQTEDRIMRDIEKKKQAAQRDAAPRIITL